MQAIDLKCQNYNIVIFRKEKGCFNILVFLNFRCFKLLTF